MASSLCGNLSEFLAALVDLRAVDDRIIYELNTSLPTKSFQNKVDLTGSCQSLHDQLMVVHQKRRGSLEECMSLTVEDIKKLKKEKEECPSNDQIIKRLRNQQTKLRELQTQVNVEEIIRQRSLKIYTEKCRSYYKPSE